MNPRMKTRAGVILSTCFALQAIPVSLNSVAVANTAHAPLFSLPQNRLSHVDRTLGANELRDVSNLNIDARAYAAYVLRVTRDRLPEAYKARAPRIAQVLIEEANRQKMDPLFVMAMIEHESQFRPTARGSHGEIGLMQIKPSTAQWLATRHAAKNTTVTSVAQLQKMLANPTFNIRCGVAYLAALKKSFRDTPELYLAAYNRGPGSVRALLRSEDENDKHAAHNTQYSAAVMDNYRLFALDLIAATHTLAASVAANEHRAAANPTL